ncbi:MAG: hypothetical protein E6940_15255 [Clostridium septicum]|uniref:hypothetical protein n=1 Tax=Clostridium septicum TaxID=1504 RepID=UPI001FA94ECF|nr:hypothetical protein [Clostridium septicum]MDU1315381.1 hypothetical protein [Clostridium septicum]
MQESEYSKSYITTNLSAIRYFIDIKGGDSKRLFTNKELGVEQLKEMEHSKQLEKKHLQIK